MAGIATPSLKKETAIGKCIDLAPQRYLFFFIICNKHLKKQPKKVQKRLFMHFSKTFLAKKFVIVNKMIIFAH
jgi:hypothetical protein